MCYNAYLWSQGNLNGVCQLVHACKDSLAALDAKPDVLGGITAKDLEQGCLQDV